MGAQSLPVAETADLVVKRAKIYTVEIDQPWAQAVAVRGDKIIAVGRDEDIEQYIGSGTSVIDAKNRLLLPGFIDCHNHFTPGAVGLDQILLIPKEEIKDAKVMMTLFGGKVVYKDRKF